MLVDLEVEHHVHAVAVRAEIFHVGMRQDVGFGENNTVALAPLQEFAKTTEYFVLLCWLSDLRPLGSNDKRHRIHPKT